MKKIKKYNKEQLNNMSSEELINLIMENQEQLSSYGKQIEVLEERIKVLKLKLFGVSSETVKQLTNQDDAFNELEDSLDKEPVTGEEEVSPEEEPEKDTPKKKRSPRKPGISLKDVENLPRKIVHLDLTEEEKRAFGEKLQELKEEVFYKTEAIPAQFYVVEYHVHVYKNTETGEFRRATKPVSLFDHSMATPSLLAMLINGKYVNHLPLNRMEQDLARNELTLRRQTMAYWINRATERYLSLVYDKLKESLLVEHVIHADETPVVVKKDGRKTGAKSTMWIYRNPHKSEIPIVLYDCCMTKAADNISNFLGKYSGTIVCDGYAAYNKYEKENQENVRIAACWAHVRRKFADIIKSANSSDKLKDKYSLSVIAIEKIKKIYEEDNKLKELPYAEILTKRNAIIRPLMEDYFAWAHEMEAKTTKGSNIGKAIRYGLNREKELMVCLEDPYVTLDNNAAERGIKTVVLGRKNWMAFDTISGSTCSAMLYSICETAKQNNLKPYEYLKYLLEEIPKHMDDTNDKFVNDLLPWSNSLPKFCINEAK